MKKVKYVVTCLCVVAGFYAVYRWLFADEFCSVLDESNWDFEEDDIDD